jgi:hypothetical protein
MRSTARVIGLMDQSGQIRNENVKLRDLDLERAPAAGETSFTLTFAAPAFLGFRQLDLERWTATRLYRLEFGNPASVRRLALPLTVTITRGEIDPDRPDAEERREAFTITEITDADGLAVHRQQVVLRLQTEAEEAGYWRDTGALKVP